MANTDLPIVVFACVRNGGRSVIARLLTEYYAANRVVAHSAGTQPGEQVHPEVLEILATLGLDISREYPKLLTTEMIAEADLAITLGCGESCPYVPGVTYRDWSVPDPAGQPPTIIRSIIADIDTRVRDLLAELIPDLHLPPSVLTPQ